MSTIERDEEALFDAYLDAALAGDAVSVDEYCAEHGLSDEMKQRLSALDVAMSDSGGGETTDGPAGPLPERIGDFRIIETIGEGGMGRVVRAEQVSLGRTVALKLIQPERANSPSARERFRREAEALARVQHSNLVSIHAVGESDGFLYIAMEEVDGRGLHEWVADETPIPIARAIHWFVQIAHAVDAVHAAGIVHRDLKPANIRITKDDRAVLLDFGLAHTEAQASLTATGVFTGTPYYASPEQVRGDDDWVAPATDVYSLGVTLYEAIAGRVPFAADSSERLFNEILIGDAASLRRVRRDVPRDLETVTATAMSVDRTKRYKSAALFADDLQAIVDLRPIRALRASWSSRARRQARRHPGWAGAITVGIVAALCLIGLLVWQGIQERRHTRTRIETEITAANEAGDAYDRTRERLSERRAKLKSLRSALVSRWMEPDERAALHRDTTAVETEASQAAERFFAAIEHLGEAERLGADPDRLHDLRAKLYVQRWRQAREERDARAEAFRELARRHDRIGRYREELEPAGTVRIESTPAGAEVFLFRYRKQAEVRDGGERRLVPVPAGEAPNGRVIEPGAWALDVIAPAPPLAHGDVIVEIAGHPVRGGIFAFRAGRGVEPFDRLVAVNGNRIDSLLDLEAWATPDGENALTIRRDGKDQILDFPASFPLMRLFAGSADLFRCTEVDVPVTYVRDGKHRRDDCPFDAPVRLTATPLERSPASRVGVTPLPPRRLACGTYLALVITPGCDAQRVPFTIERDIDREIVATLRPTGPKPRGFVYVAGGPFRMGSESHGVWAPQPASTEDVPGFWIQEREVTRGEYVAFLNDPDTQAKIKATKTPRYYPRNTVTYYRGGMWASFKRADGTYELPRSQHKFAVMGVSWNDAVAFAEWLTKRVRAEGHPWRFRLPTEAEWEKAARGVDGRRFVFGDEFMPTWVDGRYAKPGGMAFSPPISRPIDQSVYGVYDLSGGLLEWCADVPEETHRVVRGGAMMGVLPASFQVTARIVVGPESTEAANGFRLVAEIGD